MKVRSLFKLTASAISVGLLTSSVHAADFNVPAGDLKAALDLYANQSGVALIVPSGEVRGVHTNGIKGELPADAALSRILAGTGFSVFKYSSGAVGISREKGSENITASRLELAQTAPARAAVETVTVTSSKLGGADVQSIPIAITALSQEQLTATQTAGGPDLVKQVPNLTFTKTNFSGYSIQIRGIGTQAISVTTDPAVAVAMNDIPFIRNHFFEQEFYDLSQAEILRGPQGTLYGRNATAGVVNLITAKPTDQFEAEASADIGNYNNRRFEGMVNIPIVDDRMDLRVAGEWTKRDGYSINEETGSSIDGRDLWSGRVSLGVKPIRGMQVTLVWEHFSENDDRLRTSKQLCKTAPIPATVEGIPTGVHGGGTGGEGGDYLSQGCLPTSLYSPDAYQVPNGYSLAYYAGLVDDDPYLRPQFDPYAGTTQSQNLRVIESAINPVYKAKNDTLELNSDYAVTPSLTVTSQTGYNRDFLSSTEDYNRFNTAPGIFIDNALGEMRGVVGPDPAAGTNGIPADAGIFCDPQLGCSDRLVAQDLSDEHAWQFSQEFRLSSNFAGPLNFSAGGNYLHYETEENYYVFINTLTQFAANNFQGNFGGPPYVAGLSDDRCFDGPTGYVLPNLNLPSRATLGCQYIDTNPISSLNNQGHTYFLSQNPYVLNSYAGFGEVYYNVLTDLKLTGGLRWTEDQKHFVDIPSELLINGYGYPVTAVVDQQWDQLTGRAAVNWTPKLNFTDQTLVYGSYAHGYKAGGANPPGAIFPTANILAAEITSINPIHPLTFKPEFIDAYELGTKNTLLDGALTLNGDVFYYNYKNYQISEIVDRTAINLNFNATVRGAELETTWEPSPGLKFSFAGGYEDATLDAGDHAVDLMDRTAGNPGWMVVKPPVTSASNCILPTYVVAALLLQNEGAGISGACVYAYNGGVDPVTGYSYVLNPTASHSVGAVPAGYPGFDPLAGTSGDPYAGQNHDPYLGIDVGPTPNNGQGFDKNLSGNQLPNAPHFTTSLAVDYTLPVIPDWAATFHADYYWQDYSWARVFNDNPYDRLRGYTNINLALILTNQNGWQVMGYVKNIFDTTAITGDFLNTDDTGLTTNVFLTDPRLFGVRVTKNW